MNDPVPTVFIIDDDAAVLKALSRLLHSHAMQVATFASPQEFLDQFDPRLHGCLVLDVAMPNLNGLELQLELGKRGNVLPIIFLTGHGDIPMSVKAMKQGAVDFLTKPVHDQDLVATIAAALEKDRTHWQIRAEIAEIRDKLAMLTPREREVLDHVITGKLNKQIAADLGTCEKTVKVHRSHLMAKLQVGSVAELVRMAERAGITSRAPARYDCQS
ncbi:MAG: response regulator transcription factor [Gammaproteobacteria bacterium]